MRGLSERQAAACENATKPECKCRCGGKLHGAARVQDVKLLPREDPHAPAAEPELPLAPPE